MEKHLANSEEIPADLRSTIYSVMLKYGVEDDYHRLKQTYSKTDLQEEKVRILQCLGRTRIPTLLNDLFIFARSPEVRAQDIASVFVGASSTLNGLTACWEELKANYSGFYTKTVSGFILNAIVELSTSGFLTIDKAKEIGDFFTKNPSKGVDMKIKQSVEKINLNATWLKRDSENLKSWLKNNAN